MAGISALGVGSGLDLNEILNQLEKVEKQRLVPIQTQQKTINSKISGFGQLKSALTKFNDATKVLQKTELYNNRNVVTNDSYLSAKVNSSAALGDYSVKVDQLATSHSVATAAIGDKTTALGSSAETRTITIKQDNGKELNVVLNKNDTSLESIANAINHAKLKDSNGNVIGDSTVNAAVIRSGTDDYQLVITSKETGEQQRITSIQSDDQNLNSIIGFNSNDQNDNSKMHTVATAQDAKCSVNGIAITSASNTIKDVVSGVDLTLKATTATPQNVSITTDNEKTKSAIKDWVAEFNQLQSTISTLTKFTQAKSGEVDSSNGPLIGNSTLRNVDQGIRSIFSRGQPGEFSVLSQIGINMDKSGVLTIDENKLDKALNEKSDAVAQLFTGDGKETGIANRVVAKVNSFIESKGLIDAATDGLNSTLKSLEKRSEQVSDSIDKTIELYRAQFSQLDTLISSMNSLSTYLTNQFDAMANTGKKK